MEHRTVAIYARVSTDDQDAARQLHDLHQWAARMAWNVAIVVTETASGAAHARAKRRKLISIAKQPSLAKTLIADEHKDCSIDAILVTELSRWSRSTVDLVATLDDLATHGVSVLTLNGLSLDLTTPTGKLTTQVLGAVAEFERDLIRERTRSGMAHAKSQGKRLGRPPGSRSQAWKHYKYVVGKHLIGFSLSSLSREFGISRSTVKRMIDHHKANTTTSPCSPSSTSATLSSNP